MHHFVLVLVIDCDSGSIVLHYLIVYTGIYLLLTLSACGITVMLSVLSVCLFATLISRTPALVIKINVPACSIRYYLQNGRVAFDKISSF